MEHDSSSHQWWPAAAKQTLLLTVDDHSRKLLGAVFVPTDTTWNHFEHFHRRFLQHGLSMVVYTDGLSLFGHDSMTDDRDPGSEFQRVFFALGVTHLVAPSPQAKGKIERRFGTLQNRLVALLAYEQVGGYPAAQGVLDRQPAHQNATVCRTTGRSPDAAWEQAVAEKRTVTRPVRRLPCWTSTWRSNSNAAPTPPARSIFRGVAGRSPQSNAQASL